MAMFSDALAAPPDRKFYDASRDSSLAELHEIGRGWFPCRYPKAQRPALWPLSTRKSQGRAVNGGQCPAALGRRLCAEILAG